MSGRYRTIVADPPWDVNTGPSWGRNDKSAPVHATSHKLAYQTMTAGDVAALPVAALAAPDAHLYVWTINVLFARRGRLPHATRMATSWFDWPRSIHSRKPDAFLDMVEQVSPGPYAELFARRARFGWDYPIGDQALGGVAA